MENPHHQFVDGEPETEDIVEFPVCLVLQQPAAPVRISPYDVLIEQKKDKLCQPLMHFLETGTMPSNISDEVKAQIEELSETCILRGNGCLYKLLPKAAESGGHFNWKKTLAKIARKYFWPTMKQDVYRLLEHAMSVKGNGHI
ncbi:unnamed protein product, partial [Heligmosomoides polygyrus]|uniref:Integrase_H2C2 domain-containing protein n=1 Tax=Heligmosomoides polygyrus TaxID=6339 RepID=A0A183F8N7_HELPZ